MPSEDQGAAASVSSADIARPKDKPLLASIIYTPRVMLGVLLMYAGMGVFYFLRTDVPFSVQLERYGSTGLALGLGAIGFYLFFTEVAKWRALRESRFVDVDARSRSGQNTQDYDSLLVKIQQLQASARHSEPKPSFDEPTNAASEIEGHPPVQLSEFAAYFNSIRRLLEKKASIADEKASILLDKGTSYSRFGIIFFVVCIMIWQIVAHFNGFKIQYIYGIVSTSLLFIFIEFLSAWFLKQYRQFIDTSTYLIKVKSIFDRYMLVYLASKEAISNGHDTKKSNQLLLDLLRADINWPDTYLTKNADISFAKEALETMTLLMKSMKSEVKEVGRKQSPTLASKKAA